MEEAYKTVMNSPKMNKKQLYVWMDSSFFGATGVE
jgi:hypothetical protein